MSDARARADELSRQCHSESHRCVCVICVTQEIAALRARADAAEARCKEMAARLLDYWGTHGAVEGDKPGRALLAELVAARAVVEAVRLWNSRDGDAGRMFRTLAAYDAVVRP